LFFKSDENLFILSAVMNAEMDHRTLIVVPTYNEKKNVRRLATVVLSKHPAFDLLFVDDHSPDGTGALLDEMHAEDERVHVLHRAQKDGLGRAYLAGFEWALQRDYEYIFEMDADFSHAPRDIRHLCEAVGDADLALGSRYLGGIRVINWPMSRLMLSRTAALYVQGVTGMPFTDPTGGFKCFRRRVLEAIDFNKVRSNGYSFQVEMTHRAWMLGFRIKEAPIVFEERRSGESKMSGAIVREAIWMVWKLFFKCGGRRRPPNRAEARPSSGGEPV
jgi:dolichol-phosphate mannosyltransferase